MRITANRLIDLASASTTKNQSAVADASAEVSSGMRVATPSDDPEAWLSAQREKLRQALSQGTGAASAASRDRLQMTDGALASLGDIISQVQTLAVQGASDTYSPAARAGLAAQVRGLFQNALDAANTRGGDGEYVLAGAASLTAPFDPSGAYQGDASVRSVPTGDATSTPVTVAGSALTAASGVDVLPTLDQVATALANNDMTTLTAKLPDLATAVKQISSARTQAGSAMNALDQAASARSVMEQDLQQTISRLVESDTASAASELAKATQALEVSRAVSSHLVQVLAPST